ncbi:hypothetical protein [Pseudomonas nicosulfuronedens]
MSAIRELEQRFSIALVLPLAWEFLRRLGVCSGFLFRLSASPFWQTPQKEPKGLAPDIRFFA